MSRKSKIIIVILILIAVSQFVLIKLAYAGKLAHGLTYRLATVYNLSAAEIKDKENVYKISLADYLQHQAILETSLAKENFGEQTQDLSEIAWQRTLKDNWLRNFADKYELSVSKEEIEEYMKSIIGENQSFSEFAKTNYQLSLAEFKHFLIEPYILENKVYVYLLDNYNDTEGIRKAQGAYEALEAGDDFMKVASTYQTEPGASVESFWLKQEDLVDYLEPIATLAVGEFSKIVMVPGGYIIWKVENITEDEQGKAWQVQSLFIEARPLEEFFQDYVKTVDINKKFKRT